MNSLKRVLLLFFTLIPNEMIIKGYQFFYGHSIFISLFKKPQFEMKILTSLNVKSGVKSSQNIPCCSYMKVLFSASK